MLHAMIMGWLPFNKQTRDQLENQIKTEELEYKYIKKLKNSSIKNETRKALNYKLRKISDECIDLIEKMLHKDPNQRIDMIEIFEHPWMIKYKKLDEWSDDVEEEKFGTYMSDDTITENDEDDEDINDSSDNSRNKSEGMSSTEKFKKMH
jgi:serine/threonine protein kinase